MASFKRRQELASLPGTALFLRVESKANVFDVLLLIHGHCVLPPEKLSKKQNHYFT
jgi:hypothetical protein